MGYRIQWVKAEEFYVLLSKEVNRTLLHSPLEKSIQT